MAQASTSIQTLPIPIALDVLALSVVIFTPAISHFLPIPLYLLEPMRLFVLLSLILTKQSWNGYLLSFALPFASFALASHPSGVKTSLIAVELAINVWLFYALSTQFKSYFVSIFLSIVLSKVAYYILKYACLQAGMLKGDLIATTLYTQIGFGILYSILGAWYLHQSKQK